MNSVGDAYVLDTLTEPVLLRKQRTLALGAVNLVPVTSSTWTQKEKTYCTMLRNSPAHGKNKLIKRLD